ncbi:MAG: ribonuclease HI family protein [Patescibacteria group bacterium]
MGQIIIYTDGGSRNNPGPAGIGVVADLSGLTANLRGNKNKEYQWSQYIGKATNNQAEYQAIIFALKKTKALLGKTKAKKVKILLKTDSQLIASQLEGKYKLKEKEFFPYFIEIWNLKQDFGEVKFEAVPREKNKLADKLVNLALDKELNQEKLF